MPRIRLAHWHADHKPGDEIDVSAEELAALRRDGRVAAVVESPQPDSGPEQQPEEEKAPEKPGRRR